jgi:hypothetical protein
MYTLEFEIAGLPKMSNQLLRGHWRSKHGHALKWKNAVAKAMTILNKPSSPLSSAALTLTRLSSHEPDLDGLVSGFKHVIDGLVECGVLAGDKRSNIGVPDYRWEKVAPGKGKVRVRVEEVTPNNGETK